jgi:hypothetical protein
MGGAYRGIMFFGPTSLSSSLPSAGTAGEAAMNAFEWLIVLGFPVDVAAAKVMPELFTDAAPAPFVTDGRRVFEREAAAA